MKPIKIKPKANCFLFCLRALEILCQSGSILTTQGLKDGNTDRHRDNITAHT